MLEVQVAGSGRVLVCVRGEVVLDDARSLRAVLSAVLDHGDVTGIDLDLADVSFIDASGVGTLIVAHRIAVNLRVRLRLTAVSADVVRVLTLMAAADLLPRRDTEGRERNSR